MFELSTAEKNLFKAFRITKNIEGDFLSVYLVPPTSDIKPMLIATVRLSYLGEPKGEQVTKLMQFCNYLIAHRIKRTMGQGLVNFVRRLIPIGEQPRPY